MLFRVYLRRHAEQPPHTKPKSTAGAAPATAVPSQPHRCTYTSLAPNFALSTRLQMCGDSQRHSGGVAGNQFETREAAPWQPAGGRPRVGRRKHRIRGSHRPFVSSTMALQCTPRSCADVSFDRCRLKAKKQKKVQLRLLLVSESAAGSKTYS
eukprot:GHVT01019009.1.p1 GENE.GHVT01019009.1~~GHVT01019009.1.p1  ORF type:complete len:153 (+),score=18.77 GHVT01019009.1:523-981(+)